MNIVKITLSTLCLLAGSTLLHGQDSIAGGWTLQQCVDYAIAHNISIEQAQLTADNGEIRLNTSRNSRLPSVNASLGENAYFGRGPGRDGSYQDNTQLSTSIGASASLSLFEGMRIKHDIAGRTYDFQAALKDLDRAREDLSLNVCALYLKVLLNQELRDVAQRQVTLSTSQVSRSEVLVQQGKSPESELFESRSVLANDQLALTRQLNTLRLAILDLRQALNLEESTPFRIAPPDLTQLTALSLEDYEKISTVYDYAVEHRPRIQAEQFRLQSTQKALLTAKAARYPSISLSAGYSNSYYYSFVKDYNNQSFFNQLKNNGNEFLGVGINIPIFNRLSTRNNIRIANNNIRNQELAVADAQRTLRKEIEQSYCNTLNAIQQYNSASEALKTAQEAFRYQQEKMDAGRSTIFDYNDAKTRMQKAESEQVQAQFEAIFQRKILDFYLDKPLTL